MGEGELNLEPTNACQIIPLIKNIKVNGTLIGEAALLYLPRFSLRVNS